MLQKDQINYIVNILDLSPNATKSCGQWDRFSSLCDRERSPAHFRLNYVYHGARPYPGSQGVME